MKNELVLFTDGEVNIEVQIVQVAENLKYIIWI